MAYSATVIPVMIASPGDVPEVRNLIRDIIHEWNDIHSLQSNSVLMPIGWETHSSPNLGGRPQALINKNVLEKCDLLVGVFWTRIGTPTGEAESGTAEEIRKHVETGKPAMVYFSAAPVAPESLDPNQYKALIAFKDWCKGQGLIEEYDNLAGFSEKFRRQVQIIIRDNEYLKGLTKITHTETAPLDLGQTGSEGGVAGTIVEEVDNSIELSNESQQLIIEASKDKSGRILSIRYLAGQAIQTNNINFTDSSDRRSVARWEAALEQLVYHNLIVAIGYKNLIFELTAKGYEIADSLKNNTV